MLEFPDQGLRRSKNVHNSDIEPFCDWIEANVLFEEESLHLSDVVDRLIEEQFYDDQEFAWEFIDNIIAILRRRAEWLQRAYPIDIRSKRLTQRSSWREIGPYGFCLLLSVLPLFSSAREQLGDDRADQGLLLEKLSEAALRELLLGWGVHRTGWSSESTEHLPELAKNVAQLLNASIGEPELFSGGRAKDAGLDILCYKPFPDGRGGYLCILVQCASGASTWKRKRMEPNLGVWRHAVIFDFPPASGLVIPFAISAEQLKESSVIAQSLIIDRIRLLLPGRDGGAWLPSDLDADLVSWCEATQTLMPRLN